MPLDPIQLEIRVAAELARQRERQRRKSRERQRRRTARKPPVATLELLGCEPDPAWLASIAASQARLRTAAACLSKVLQCLTACKAGVSRRELRATQVATGELRARIGALSPASVCPVCHASDPACQTCAGLGCLTLAQASQLSHELLHDR